MKEDESLDGIICSLTLEHGGNVQQNGIVTITSKAVLRLAQPALKSVTDLTSDSLFCSDTV
jgi:hypothetical protein